jgi:EAL domain-containing protein (putative c-di-GMP-specific phosphodiesterase class I)
VETNEQLDYLRMLGCDQYQGYLSSRPLPAAEFEAMMRAASALRHAA